MSANPLPGDTGAQAEGRAQLFLEQQGLRLVERNYRGRRGEIDLIMQEGETLVFVEVRYRKRTSFGSPAESVTMAKQQRIITTAMHFLQSKPGRQLPPCRFDVLAIVGKETQNIDWIKDAFQAYS